MSGYSGLDFSTVGGELAYWLTHVTQAFKGGYPGSGENGYDFGLPHGTPVYAILPGKVVGAGYYGGGGVVSVQYNPQNIVYYQHLDLNQVQVGQQVATGQQLGLSGGQLSGGNHPATCCSGGDHIEVGLNAPFGGMWNPNNVTPNANPIGLFNSLLAQFTASNVSTGGSGGAGGGTFIGLVAPTGSASQSGHCITPFGNTICIPDTIWNWLTQPIRILKLGAGVLLLLIAAALVIVPVAGKVAGPITEVTGVATGQPEVVAAGAALSSISGQKSHTGVTITKPARQPRTQEIQMQAAPATTPLRQAPVTAPIDQQPAATPKLGGTPNPMSPEEIAKARGKAPPAGIAAFSQRFPTPQRGPGTGLMPTYFRGARTVVTGAPIPDAVVLDTEENMRKWWKAHMETVELTKREQQKRATMTPEDTRKALGLSGLGGAAKVPGTEVTLESEQASLKSMQGLLAITPDPKVRAAIERDIATIQARIKKMQGG